MTTIEAFERTWDGLPIAKEWPRGAAIVVYRWLGGQPEVLLLHRRHHGPDYDGDWAWGPPGGARFPDEAIARCAERELLEETGLQLAVRPIDTAPVAWATYRAEAPADAVILLSEEHDRYTWLPPLEAVERVTPASVREQVRRALDALLRGLE